MKSTASVFPVAIALCGITALIALGGYRVIALEGGMRWAVATIIILYGAWILSEFRITAGETGRGSDDDKGTLEAYAVARFLTMLAALGFPAVWTTPGPWFPAGLVLFMTGVAFRLHAIRSLGRFYSHRVRTPERQTIIRTGPYRYLRHPAYAGMLLAHVGIVVLLFNWFVLTVFTLVFIPTLVRRIRVEESHLFTIPAYATFASGRARVVPGIW